MTQAEKALLKAAAKAEKDLLNAAEKGKLATLTRRVEEGVNVNATHRMGFTALMHAAISGKLDCLEHLIAKGANLEATDFRGTTALMMAAINGELDCLDHLIAKGANPNAQHKGGKAALHWAAHTRPCEYHTHEGQVGHAPCVESLLKAGGDASLKDIDGMTALDIAKERKHVEVIRILENVSAVAAAQAKKPATKKASATKPAAAKRPAVKKTIAKKPAAAKKSPAAKKPVAKGGVTRHGRRLRQPSLFCPRVAAADD